MSFVFVSPDLVSSAAADVESIGAALARAQVVAAGPTAGVISAAADEVSTAIAALFSAHAVDYGQVAAQALAFHEQLTQTLAGSAGSYAMAEVAAASPLQAIEQSVLGVLNAPTNALLGRPLIGDGANGAAGSGQAGGAGGFCGATVVTVGLGRPVRPVARAGLPG